MVLQQKNNKTDKTAKGRRILHRALTLGLASTLSAITLASEKTENSDRENKSNKTETPVAKPDKNTDDCAYFINNVVLDADSPIEQIYKVDKRKAFYSHYLNGGKGGIVFTKYQISDTDLFANANRTSAAAYEKAIKSFETCARNFGYKEEIKNLDDVRKSLDYYAGSRRKKDKHIGEILERNGTENGLAAALNLKNTIAEMNAANLKTAKHEQIHASIGHFTKAINTGDVMLAPGGIYLARMADELRAQIKGGNIAATEQGLEDFFNNYGAGYKGSYTPDLLSDDSYKRMFAYSLNEEKADISLPAEINNLFLGFEMEGVDNLGNSCTVNGVETGRGYVFFSGRDDVSHVKMKSGRVLPLNCLVDEKGKIIKDKDGKAQAVRVIYKDGNFTAVVAGSVLSTKDMDENLKGALRYILSDMEDNAKKLVLKSLDKHCREDAELLTNALLCDRDGMMKLRSETDAEHVAADLAYIKEKRRVNLQEVNEKNLTGLNLIRIVSPQEKALQLTVSMFQQKMSDKNP